MINELVLAIYSCGGFITGGVVSLILFFHIRS